jgi:hypothetical protein
MRLFFQVNVIPSTFKDLQSYFKAFQLPLLEETRAQLRKGLGELHTADHMVVGSSRRDVTRGGHGSQKEVRKIELDIIKFAQREKDGRWKPKPTDILLLSAFLPANIEVLLREHPANYSLAMITNSDNFFKDSFYVQTCGTAASMFKQRHWYAIYINNVATVRRVWAALNPDPEVFYDERKFPVARQNLYRNKRLVEVSATVRRIGISHFSVNLDGTYICKFLYQKF